MPRVKTYNIPVRTETKKREPKKSVQNTIPSAEVKQVVILGGGFGGVRAALDLSKWAPSAKIVLVDRNKFHSYTADYYELSAALFVPKEPLGREEYLELASSVALPFKDIFSGRANLKFIQSEVQDVDFKRKRVLLKEGHLHYDYLVIALGSETNFCAIPHLNERGLEIKTTYDALNIRSTLDEAFETSGKNDVVSIVIGGGGFTGCEFAGELGVVIKKLAKLYNHPAKNVSVTVLEGSGALLGRAGAWFSEKAKRRLEKLGVKVELESFITDVKKKEVILKDGRVVKFSLLIWTAGVRPNCFLEKLKGLKLYKNNCVIVDSNLQAAGRENVFVIGDLAYFLSENETPLPMTAQVAMEQGHYVARFIASKFIGKSWPEYRPKKGRFIVPLGSKYALADLGFIKISGFLPWLLKRVVGFKYFFSILPFGKALQVWREGIKVSTSND